MAIVLVDPASALVASQAKRVSIADADRILRARTADSLAAPSVRPSSQSRAKAFSAGTTAVGCASASSQPVEITALASSLKCDIDLIYEYVYNNIEYEPLFGSNKGALGTLLDQRGDDIDQAQLFVALLNAAGITQTSFVYGYITVTGPSTPSSPCTGTQIASAPGWLGVKNDFFAILNLLSNGGIPLGNGTYYGNDGTIDCLDVAHVWVQVTINGTNYVFDPSFKQHVVSTGLPNLGTVLGYSQSQFMSDAGGTIDAVSISNINRANVRRDLTAYAGNLVNYIKANNPGFALTDVIGGKTIVPLTGSPIRQTALPYLSANQPSGFPQNWGSSVPNAYRACLAISMPGVTSQQPCSSATTQTIVLYADVTYGQRITVFSSPDPGVSGNYIPKLLVNGATPTTGTATGPSTAAGKPWGIFVAVTHPYAFTDDNQSRSLSVNAGGAYLVSAGWGRVGRGMVAKHQQLLAQALSVPGADSSSEPILGESLAVISYNWLAENGSQHAIGDAIGQVTTQYHHGIGITAQTAIQQSGSQGPYVDLPLNVLSIGQGTCWPSTSCPFPGPTIGQFYTDSGTSSSLESAVLLQTQAPTPNMVAASTVSLVDQNAATGAKTFLADGTTSAGVSAYFASIRPTLAVTYSSTDLSAIDHDISSTGAAGGSPTGNQVLAPANGNQTVGLWKGAGYSVITQTGTSIQIVQRISGGLSGGFSGTDVPDDDMTENVDSTIAVPPLDGGGGQVLTFLTPQFAPQNTLVSEPVDGISGIEVYTHQDLIIGNGSYPYSLPFTRTYRSSSSLTDTGLGNGWTHNYQFTAATGSNPYSGMGANSPIDAATAIAAIYVSQSLLQNTSQSAQALTLGWIVDRWFTDQLINNVTLISKPDTVEEFVVCPHLDGAAALTYNPPLGSSVVLTGNGTGAGNPTSYTYAMKDGTKLLFSTLPDNSSTLPVTSWAWPSGVQVTFAYNANDTLTTVSNNLGRQLTLSYVGTHVLSVSDGSRSVNYAYSGNTNLASMTDPLGFATTYAYDTTGTYDTAGRLTQIFYPSAPSNPFVTNYYDGLGHVIQQKNANGAAGQFYFAGSRSEIVDALGNREVTYQTPRGKITKDAHVLASSFGDVFNDTPQNNGVINVTSNQYDGRDRLILSTLPEGGATAYAYSPDLLENIVSITRTAKPGSPLSALVTTAAYDPVYNKPTRVTDPLGLVRTMSYDPATGNMIAQVSDAGSAGHFNATTRFTYNGVGQVLTALDPQLTLTSISYDAFGDPISVIRDCCGAGHLNQTVTSVYDAIGNVITTTDPNGNVTSKTYDLNRQVASMTLPQAGNASSGLVTTYAYDPDGKLLQTHQSAGGALLSQTSVAYSFSGQPVTNTDANGNVTRLSYDLDDRLVSVSDPLGRMTTYGYDALDRKVSTSNPAIQSSPLLQQTYTPDGLVASLITSRSNTVFSTTTYTPDGFDRPSTTTYPDASFEILAYDADGNITSRKTRKGDTISFTYDTLNRKKTKAAPSEATVTYSYDLAGRPLGASDTSATITTPTSAGTVSTMSMSYDGLNHLIAQSWSPVQAQAPPTASTVTFSYAYDGSNRRTSQAATDNSYWSYPAATATNVVYTANSLDQYTAVGAVTPTYDANGNLTFDGTYTYGYDAENRLTSASQGGTTVATYAYDALGHRKSATAGSTTTILVNGPDNRALLDYDGTSGQLQRWYAFGVGPNNVLNQVNISAGTRATPVSDVQGSVVASLDSSSGTLTKGGFQPYGEGNGVTAATVFGYTGARIAVGGLYDFRARFYSPILGRFVQADPTGTAGGANLYAYARNNPLNLIDLSGKAPDNPILRAGQFASESDLEEELPPEQEGIEPRINNNRGTEGLGSALNFSQTTASPFFSSQGIFATQSIAGVAAQLRAGSLAASDVTVQTVDLGGGSLIVNTRSALSLLQAGVPQSGFSLIDMTGDAATEANITQRLLNNGLTNSGTSTLRITGSGPNASTLIPGP